MKKKTQQCIFTTLLVFYLFWSGVTTVSAQITTFDFKKNLTIGSRGADVLELQKTLNQSPETRLAASGPGSPGQETTYFGPITRTAVIKYQEIHRAEILLPLGLSRGTGFFGPSTQKKMNSILDLEETEAKINTQLTQNVTQQEQKRTFSLVEAALPSSFIFDPPTPLDKLDFYYVSKQSGRPGELLTMYGSGFTTVGNVINFGGKIISDIKSETSQELSFTIPELSPGRYKISISNSKGKADARYFRVLNSVPISAPTIESVSPSQGAQGTRVTITGSGFSSTENLIYTTFNEIENVTSQNSTTLTFTIPFITDNIDSGSGLPAVEESGSLQFFSQPKEIELFPLFIYVENNNGVSNETIFLVDDFKKD